jgi:hypothetical protein
LQGPGALCSPSISAIDYPGNPPSLRCPAVGSPITFPLAFVGVDQGGTMRPRGSPLRSLPSLGCMTVTGGCRSTSRKPPLAGMCPVVCLDRGALRKVDGRLEPSMQRPASQIGHGWRAPEGSSESDKAGWGTEIGRLRESPRLAARRDGEAKKVLKTHMILYYFHI